MANQEDTNQMIEDVLSKEADAQEASEEYSLNDDRRVKTLSPTALVMKRFLRNRVAVSGLIILTFMFLFSFVGGMISPYKEDQIFYRYDEQDQQWAAVAQNTELRYITKNDDDFPSVARAKFVLAIKQGADSFESQGTTYTYEQIGDELYKLYVEGNDESVALATYDTVSSSTEGEQLDCHQATVQAQERAPLRQRHLHLQVCVGQLPHLR